MRKTNKRKLNKSDKRILKHLKWIEKIFKEEKTNIYLFGWSGYSLEVLWKGDTEEEQKIMDKYTDMPSTKSVLSLNIPCDGGDTEFRDKDGNAVNPNSNIDENNL